MITTAGNSGSIACDVAQQRHPVHAFHLQVGDEDAGKIRAQHVKRRRRLVVDEQFEPGKPEPLRHRLAHRRLVVDEQDRAILRHGLPSSTCTVSRRWRGSSTVSSAPPSGALRGVDLPAEVLDDAVGDGEAEAEPLADRLGREERIEDAVDLVRRNAGSVVGDDDDHGVVGRATR